MVDTYRCKIVKEHGKYFTGIDYNGNRYKIKKNEYIHCKAGDDIYFYANPQYGFFSIILVPVSDEEAGVYN
ncbi:MAG: hypothetical protein ACLRRH_11060 [Clostridium sp.]